MDDYTATYSPDDNKLRLYAVARLDPETFAKVKEAGFRWAPKQKLFVAPMWTPSREDLLIEMAGEVGDEDTTLTERTEERAERFEDYSEKRAKDAETAHAGVKAIADGIPMGQPVLVGHHSEKHARRDAKRIENGMRKAVKMWETSAYWEQRAAGAIHAAKYKERPEVRARRIKKIEADKRKTERNQKESDRQVRTWETLHDDDKWKKKSGETATLLERAVHIVNHGSYSYDSYRVLEKGEITPVEAKERYIEVSKKSTARRARWLVHYDNRLTYEKAMLDAQGGSDLLKPKARPKQLPLCNYRAPGGVTVERLYYRGEFETFPQVEMTKAEYSTVHPDQRGCKVVENSHRVRIMAKKWDWACVFLTDSKVHAKPEPVEPEPPTPPAARAPTPPAPERPEQATVDALKASLEVGVEVCAVNQLFPTPVALAERMADEADIQPGDDVLEPSAGTGALLGAMGGRMFGRNPERGSITAIEINTNLANRLKTEYPLTEVFTADFLEYQGGTFHKIIMNPPFEKGQDIKHIKHAAGMLAPGGVLVALCAGGSRRQDQLEPLAEYWEPLPAGTFKEAGTNVSTVLLIIRAEGGKP